MMISLPASNPAGYLKAEYERHQALFAAQPAIVQRFIEAQARTLADALLGNRPQVRFTLPDRVVGATPRSGEAVAMRVPDGMRRQTVGGWTSRFRREDLREGLRRGLSQLEQSPDRAVNTSAALLRHVTAVRLIHTMLPSGRPVTYRAEDGERVATIPAADGLRASAITAENDAIAQESPTDDEGRGQLQVPFVPAALRFYLPQWVALDADGRLLVNTLAEAEAHLASMQRYVAILHKAVALAPYMVADDQYREKRYSMLGQLINQGRALAAYRTREIIATIRERAGAGRLNRGLGLSLPYFDDQELSMESLDFEVIPAGRIMFVPAFVVRAARSEQAKVAQDTRLSLSTRKYLLRELELLEQTFTASTPK